MDLCHVPATREKGWYLALMAPQRQRSQLCLAGPLPALLPPARLAGLRGRPAAALPGRCHRHGGRHRRHGLHPGRCGRCCPAESFLAIRKAGHLCVQTAAQPYSDYSGREKVMEVRTDAISPGLRILLVDQWVETGGTMRAAIELVERLGGVVAGRRGHPRVHPWVQWDHRSHGLWWPALSPPVCPHRCRCHLHGEQRGGGSGSRSATSAPTVSPPACSPASTSTASAGTDVAVSPRVSPAAPRGTQGCWLCRTGMLLGGKGNSSIHPPASLRAWGLHQGQEDPQPVPAPCPQPHTFLTKHKKDFIKTKGSLRTSPPASSTWVCIATEPHSCLPQPGVPRQAMGWGAGGGRDISSGPAGGAPLLVQGCEHRGGRAVPSLAALGFPAGR
uniref:adenine phosphoribosyltransferase n=1 Tax=Taeniopygia guttata TaxID=59729 RepID=A0A674H5Q6_TAEGU